MRLDELGMYRSIAKVVVDLIRRQGTTSAVRLSAQLKERTGFTPRDRGFVSLSEFLRKYAPELAIVSHSGTDVMWGLKGTAEKAPRKEAVREPESSYSADKSPITVVDDLIRRSQIIIQERGAADFIAQLFPALERWLSSPAPSDGSVDSFIRTHRTRREQRRIAACLIRLLHQAPTVFEDDPSLRVYAIKLFDEAVPDLYQRIGLRADQQTYEKLTSLRSAVDTVDRYLFERVEALRNLAEFEAARQAFMRGFKADHVSAVYEPFFPSSALADAGEAFRKVQEYIDAADEQSVQLYESALSAVAEWQRIFQEDKSSVADRFFERAAQHLLAALKADFSTGPYSKPGIVTVASIDKRYPLAAAGAEIALGFEVSSTGEGPALDVEITATTNPDRLVLIDSARALGNLASGSTLGPVEFRAIVNRADAAPLLLELHVEWKNADGKPRVSDTSVQLESQAPDIPWDALRASNPYSLDYVQSERELMGRDETLARLESKIRSRSVGSFWVYGQKRVGKTSIVKTLQSRIEQYEPDFLVVYLDPGEYIRSNAQDTINSLTRRLCEEIRDLDPRFETIPLPDAGGALSLLDGYLRALRRIDGDRRILFVLDEFDELPIDLYRLGEVGNAFFLSLRSISGKGPYGFVLVGGERMELIVSLQGDHLNRFEPLPVDYFDPNTQWKDFEDLVRRPVHPWCTITDRAVAEVFEASAGNPFFAKWICNSMYRDVVARKDAYVTEREMRRAVTVAAGTAGSNQFQHFWKDGIFEVQNERIEDRMMVRRKVLLAFADTIRQNVSPTKREIIRRAEGYGVTEDAARSELQDFERRSILVSRAGAYECKVKLFERWLVERGVKDIVTSFADESAVLESKRQEELLRVGSDEVVQLAGRWGVFKGTVVGEERVRAWLNQFGSYSDQRLMFTLLQSIRFYSSSLVRSKLREIHTSVKSELARRGVVRKQASGALKTTDNVVIATIDGAGKSGPHMQRLYINENNIYAGRAVSPTDLGRALREYEDVRAVVLIDDFIGTGVQAASGFRALLEDHAGILRERKILVFFAWVSGFESSAEKVAVIAEEHGIDLVTRIGDPLYDEDRCFSASSTIFADQSDRQRAKEICVAQGRRLDPKQPLGYGGCEANVVFEDNCPNNTLPVFWKRADGWFPLFPRH